MAKKKVKRAYNRKPINPIFLPINYQEGKDSKIELMKSELSILRCMRTLENIKRIKSEKYKLKKSFNQLLIETRKELEKTIKLLPEIYSTNPEPIQPIKSIQEKKAPPLIIESPIEVKEIKPPVDRCERGINKEVALIQEKLKKLSQYQR